MSAPTPVPAPPERYFVAEDSHGDPSIWEDRGHRDPLLVLTLGGLPDALRNWLTATLPQQPDPATVWTDGDVVQGPRGTSERRNGRWYFTGEPENVWGNDYDTNNDLRNNGYRVLRQQSTGIGCEDPAKVRAEAWDEGAEATAEWMANNPSPSGVPHDPSRNPYEDLS